jgi:hypothetical protein
MHTLNDSETADIRLEQLTIPLSVTKYDATWVRQGVDFCSRSYILAVNTCIVAPYTMFITEQVRNGCAFIYLIANRAFRIAL